MMTSTLREFAAEPAVADAPRRVWRDWLLVGVASVGAVLEAVLRDDLHWRGAALVVALVTIPVLLIRRQRPLLAVTVGCGAAVVFTSAVWLTYGDPGGLFAMSAMLINIYALYRWGSGRDGLRGLPVIAVTAVICNLTDSTAPSDVIGGIIVLAMPIGLGLLVRTRSTADQRRVEAIRSRERERLARDLHDAVAHHVSAIAIQAQAGKEVAATEPETARRVLDVIEEEAARTLAEMRSIVGVLRGGEDGELAPQPGIADIARLASSEPVRIDTPLDALPNVAPVVGTALFRIAQEAVTNALRHGTAVNEVRIAIEPSGRDVQLTVEDDGRPVGTTGVGGYGLAGMAERVALLGGTFDAGPDPSGGGWRVFARLPCEASA